MSTEVSKRYNWARENRQFKENDILYIDLLSELGMSAKKISTEMNCSTSLIRNIIHRTSYSDIPKLDNEVLKLFKEQLYYLVSSEVVHRYWTGVVKE